MNDNLRTPTESDLGAFDLGDYRMSYLKYELSPNLPRDVFFDFLKPEPVIHKENFLTKEEKEMFYQNCLEKFDKRTYATIHDYSSGASVYTVDVNGRFTHIIPISTESYASLEKKLVEEIYPLLKEYYKIDGEFRRTEGWQFLGYGEEFFFKPHCDNCSPGSTSLNEEDRNYKWFCNMPTRKFTVLLYLNDSHDFPGPGEYSGGQLCLNRIQERGKPLEYSPKAGTLIAMPSNFLFMHEVKPVTRGYRFAAVTWLDVI